MENKSVRNVSTKCKDYGCICSKSKDIIWDHVQLDYMFNGLPHCLIQTFEPKDDHTSARNVQCLAQFMASFECFEKGYNQPNKQEPTFQITTPLSSKPSALKLRYAHYCNKQMNQFKSQVDELIARFEMLDTTLLGDLRTQLSLLKDTYLKSTYSENIATLLQNATKIETTVTCQKNAILSDLERIKSVQKCWSTEMFSKSQRNRSDRASKLDDYKGKIERGHSYIT